MSIIRLEPASFAKAIMLEAADIPAHMTIAQWRAQKRADRRERPRTGRRWRRRRTR
jgi:hypothetical protein